MSNISVPHNIASMMEDKDQQLDGAVFFVQMAFSAEPLRSLAGRGCLDQAGGLLGPSWGFWQRRISQNG
jgi:hypothetical protein